MRSCLIVLLVINCSLSSSFSQDHHYRFYYNNNGKVSERLFEALEKDLGRTIDYNISSEQYTYLQHLRNQNLFLSKHSQIKALKQDEDLGRLHQLLEEIVIMFPHQSTGYYYLAQFYMDKGYVDMALAVLSGAVVDFGLESDSFNYLEKIYAENNDFVNGVNDIRKLSETRIPVVAKDSLLIDVVDSILKTDQMYRKADYPDPRFTKQQQIDSANAATLKEIVKERGWISKYLGRDYHFAHIPVIHFSIAHQLFFLNHIIADCISYNGKWTEAEQIIWKIVNHTSRIEKDSKRYHSIPLLFFNEHTGKLNLEKSLLSINSTVIALLNSKKDNPIWLVATTENPFNQHMENLALLKKYFSILGYDEDKIFIQAELLDYETESSLLLKTPVVIKEIYGTN